MQAFDHPRYEVASRRRETSPDAVEREVRLQSEHLAYGFVDVCSDGTASCVLDPTSWVPGQTQTLNLGLERKAEAPFFPESFAQRYMTERDEVWLGVTWEF